MCFSEKFFKSETHVCETFVPDLQIPFFVNVKCVGVVSSNFETLISILSKELDTLKLISSANLNVVPLVDENVLSPANIGA